MNNEKPFDSIVIGAGIIGAAITLELTRRGHRTLCVDKLPAAGYGSTSNSCAIIRTHYSTLDGTALAWESYHHWKNWGDYLGFEDERGLARFIESGMVVVRSEAAMYRQHLTFHDELGIAYEEWDADTLRSKVPFYDVTAYYPPRRPDDEEFGTPSEKEHPGAVFYRASSLMLDESATQNARLGRASLIAHETAHMWFGDLVTMRWFDDVWTKEVFANFMAAKIVHPSFPEVDHDLRFLLAHHPAAYAVDRTPGANAIRQPT